MVNASSLPGGATAVFDLDTHDGVMHLLASVRASDLTAAEKNELRDLIFLYTNGGKDQTVRRSLEQKISNHALPPVPRKASKKSLPPPPTIGKYRQAPSFKVPAQTIPVAPAPKQKFTTEPAWNHETPTESVAPSVTVPVSPRAETVDPAPVKTVPAAPLSEVAAPSMNIPVQSAASVTPGDNEAYLMRIREIKALVNEKVGNPVNLVDINNEVGREYMAALLDAMKKINSGTSALSAMKRLEDAFAQVEITLKNQGSVSPVSAPSVPARETTPEPAPYVAESALFTPPVPPAPQFDAPAPVPPPPFSPVPPAFTPPQPPAPAVAHVSENVTRITTLGETVPPPAPPPSQKPYFTSLAEYGEKPAAAATAPAPLANIAGPGDPLFAREVEEGLQQLLSEWSLFKKSGLFGTGPKGKDHPLFKKMAPLQIPLLLAGRFEGATQEIKQSVTDYMNGWRYEQGLIYQQGETFEHYLRRVIRHIIDLQKGK